MAHSRGLAKQIDQAVDLPVSEEERIDLLAELLLEIVLEEGQDAARN